MKYIVKISLALIIFATVFVSCKDEEVSMEFGLQTDELVFGSEGGVQNVNINSVGKWVASTDAWWILISPTNGNASTECKISIDSSILNNSREAEIKFSSEGQIKTVKVNQFGFAPEIIIADGKTHVDLPDYAPYGKTYFDVKVLTNVKFDVDISDENRVWINNKEYNQDLSNLAKPRTVNVRFEWQLNSRPSIKEAIIKFLPKGVDDPTIVKTDVLTVKQAAAPEIKDDRSGDSLALLAISRSLNTFSWNTSLNMLHWEGIELNKQGRVVSAEFIMVNTKISLPYEIQYLTQLEKLRVFGNGNKHLLSITLGPEVTKLRKLKSLEIGAYGITDLCPEFATMTQLEEINFTSNNFSAVPDMINPDNFPNLRKLDFSGNRRNDIYDLSNNTLEDIGLGGAFPERLLEWDSLRVLALTYNYFEGSIPDMEHYKKYEDKDGFPLLAAQNIPKVLPVIEELKINLNRLSGEIPAWILNHPKLCDWAPYIFIFSQEGKDTQGNPARFTNEPDKIDCGTKPSPTQISQHIEAYKQSLFVPNKAK